LNKKELPQQWKVSIIVAVYKKTYKLAVVIIEIKKAFGCEG
jgi:hypothetical protein